MSSPAPLPTVIEVEPASLLTLSTGEEVTVPAGEVMRLDVVKGHAELTLLESGRAFSIPAHLVAHLLALLGAEAGAA